MDTVTILNIQQQVGLSFLQYILNKEDLFAQTSSANDFSFLPEQELVLNELDQLLLRCSEAAVKNPNWSTTHYLVQEGIINNTKFNEYRRRCGGYIPDPTGKSDVEDYLINYAINIYPALLIFPAFGPDIRPALDFDMIGHSKTFTRLLKQDSNFSKLVIEQHSISQLSYLLKNGIIATAFDPFLLQTLTERCFLTCCFRLDFSLITFISELQRTLDTLKKIATGQEFTYSTFRGLYGIQIQNMKEFWINSNVVLRPMVSTCNPSTAVRDTVTGSNLGLVGAVLEYKRVISGKPIQTGNFESSYTDHDIIQFTKNFKLATVFSTDHLYAPFDETFYEWDLPLTSHHYHKKEKIRGGIITISPDTGDDIKDWMELLANTDISKAQVPIKRLLYATFERNDPEDSLVDAFIAWEGMFSGKTETVFQVTGALTKFLEPDVNERRHFQKRLKDLYTLRSHLLHGAPDENKLLKREDINKLRNEVLSIGLQSLKKLLKCPILLKLSPQERVAHLLIFS